MVMKKNTVLTIQSFLLNTNYVSKKIVIKYLEYFSKYMSEKFKFLLIDNAIFLSIKDIALSQNIVMILIPP